MEELGQPLAQRSSSNLRAKLRQCLESLFAINYFFYREYDKTNQFDKESKLKLVHYVAITVQTLQLLSLSFPCALDSWRHFEWLSSLVSMVRLDFFMVRLGLGNVYFYALIGFSTFLVMTKFFLLLKMLGNSNYDTGRYRYLISIPLKVLKGVLFVPSTKIMVATLYYSFNPTTPLLEYSNTDASLDVGMAGVLCTSSIVFVVGIVLLDTIFQYEPCLTRRHSQLMSRPHSVVEVRALLGIVAMVVSHTVLLQISAALHLATLGGLAAFLCAQYLYFLPFYNTVVVYTHICCFGTCFIGAVSQLLAIATDSGAVILIFLMCFVPVQLSIVSFLIQKRIDYIRANYTHLAELGSMYQYELILRIVILDYLDANAASDNRKAGQALSFLLQAYTSLNQRFGYSKFPSIWEFLFTLRVRNKEALARILLTKAVRARFDLESSYLHYKYKRMLWETPSEYIEEVDFVNFHLLSNEVLHYDLQACQLQLRFWNELSKNFVHPELLEGLALQLQQNLCDTKVTGDKLASRYSCSRKAMQMLGTFYCDVCNEEAKGNELLRKADNLKDQGMISQTRAFSLFDEAVGIILVSVSDTGAILSINDVASKLLCVNRAFVADTHISTYLPPPLSHTPECAAALRKVIRNAEVSLEFTPDQQFLVSSEGYLVDCTLGITLVGLDDCPVFLCAFKPPESNREIVYISSDHIILLHSATAPVMLGYSAVPVHLSRRHISHFLPSFRNYVNSLRSVNKYSVPTTFKSIYVTVYPFSDERYVIYMTDDLTEAKSWDAAYRGNKDFIDEIQDVETVKIRGILKRHHIDKNLAVHFSDMVQYVVLDETDFEPGQSSANSRVRDIETIPGYESMSITDIINSRSHVDIESLQDGSVFSLRDSDPRRGSASLASGSNASSISFSNHFRSRQLLMNVTGSVTRFKIFILLTLLLVIASTIAMIVFVNELTDRYTQDARAIYHAERYALVTRSVVHVRQVAEGLSRQPQLQDDLAKLKRLNKIIWDDQFSDPELIVLFTQDEFVTWEMSGNQIKQRKENLQDLMQTFANNLEKILLAETVSVHDPAFFYVYRNGPAEILEALRNSLDAINRADQIYIANYVLYYMLLISLSILLMVLCFIFVVMPALLSIERSHQRIWQLFFRVPLDTISEIKGKSEERLEQVHSQEPAEPMPEHYFKDMTQRHTLRARRKYLHILGRVSSYYIFTTAFLVAFHFLGYDKIHSTLVNWNALYDSAADRTALVNSVYFWTKEYELLSTDDSYFLIVPEQQHIAHPSVTASVILGELLEVENKLIHGTLTGLKNAEHRGYLFEGSSEPLLMHGLHAALQEYMDFTQLILYGDDTLTAENLEQLETQRQLLDEYSWLLQSEYETELSAFLDTVITSILWLTVAYSSCVLVGYFTVFIPLVNRTRAEIKRVWGLGAIIPHAQRNAILMGIR